MGYLFHETKYDVEALELVLFRLTWTLVECNAMQR